MKIGSLLEKLISIANTTKTDFAIYMNMTPSGLSKILAGKRLPFIKEKKQFCNQAAIYFAEAIYENNCFLKFNELFPVIYNFNSQYEFEEFLSYAIEYAFEKDMNAESDINQHHPDKAVSYLGYKMIINMLCIIISDNLLENQNDPQEFFGSLPLTNNSYYDIFQRIKILTTRKHNNIIFNHFWDIHQYNTGIETYKIHFLEMITEAEKRMDLFLWSSDQKFDSYFLVMRGAFILNFTIQLDGMPLLTCIEHRGFVSSFLTCLKTSGVKKCSYTKDELIALLCKNPTLLSDIRTNSLHSIYHFVFPGYMFNEDELTQFDCPIELKRELIIFYKWIMAGNSIFHITFDSLRGFYAKGVAVVPLLGSLTLQPSARISYLKRLETFLSKRKYASIKCVNSVYPKSIVLCTDDISIIYIPGGDDHAEKIHYLGTGELNGMLQSELQNSGPRVTNLSTDLWNSFLDEAGIAIKQREYP